MSVRVLFVCLGNICRSPTAHGVFEQLVRQQRLDHRIAVDSAGTGDWHIGRAPDQRSSAAALRRGYDLRELRARQISAQDFHRFDYILAMDQQNLRDLQAMRPSNFAGELALFLSYGNCDERDVPDPYYGDGDGFERVLDLVENASQQLLQRLIERHRLLHGAQ
jgi:protein-tyrosine phosphatase